MFNACPHVWQSSACLRSSLKTSSQITTYLRVNFPVVVTRSKTLISFFCEWKMWSLSQSTTVQFSPDDKVQNNGAPMLALVSFINSFSWPTLNVVMRDCDHDRLLKIIFSRRWGGTPPSDILKCPLLYPLGNKRTEPRATRPGVHSRNWSWFSVRLWLTVLDLRMTPL